MIASQKTSPYVCAFFGLLVSFISVFSEAQPSQLRENWLIQSSAEAREDGAAISSVDYKTTGWHAATVPTTVLAALIHDGLYKNPYYSKNLRDIPGTTYNIGSNFSNQEMTAESPFAASWWYRTTFENPANGNRVWVRFEGINYRANIWINGKKIADKSEVVGTFRTFEFEVSKFLHQKGTNVLAVEVFPPLKNDLGLTWVDWNPAPPDKNMGLWGPVSLIPTGDVRISAFHVSSDLVVPSLAKADLKISANITNSGDAPVEGDLAGTAAGVPFKKHFTLAANASDKITITPADNPSLTLTNPRVWWPVNLGAQNLYDFKMEADVNGAASDAVAVQFGVRKVTSELTASGHLLFKINGRNILVRGGGWAPDMLLREEPEKEKAELQYVKDLGLNTVRGEGKFGNAAFSNLADKMGILQMMGWSCCDHWELWKDWSKEDYQIAAESLRSRIRALRNHPSSFMWLNGSDNAPPADVEKMYLKIEQEEEWDVPVVSSASSDDTDVTGPSGVKMTGPYQYIAPNYWLNATTAGGAFGFNTETSPGPSIPVLQSLREMFAPNELWPPDQVAWDLHNAGGWFKTTLKYFNTAVSKRFGKPVSLEDYALKSQVLAYETHRAMFEAYARNKYESTGIIQWMLNSAWPSLAWHLFDFYLRPGGAYYGAKKANELVHVLYSYDDNSIAVVNHSYKDLGTLNVRARVFDFNMKEVYNQEQAVAVGADSSVKAFKIPSVLKLTMTYFVKLELANEKGEQVSGNFYWLSLKPDIPGRNVPNESLYSQSLRHADLRLLSKLPKTSLQVKTLKSGPDEITVAVTNKGSTLAFFVQFTADENGKEVLPVFWSDNDISLLPGETRTLTAKWNAQDRCFGRCLSKPAIHYTGWNVTAR